MLAKLSDRRQTRGVTSGTLDLSATKKTSLRPKTRLLGELFWTLENAEKYFLNIQAVIY